MTNIGSGMAIGSIFVALLFKQLTLVQLYVVGALEGSFFVFANLSRFAAIPRVVSKEQIPSPSACPIR